VFSLHNQLKTKNTMTTKKSVTILVVILMGINFNLFAQTAYTFPNESEQHEGTWLQWPHQYEYGTTYRNSLDATWVAMTNALQANEKVHIIAYNTAQRTRITNLLTAVGVPLTNIDFKIFKTNDVWVRDNGPIYARNAEGNLVIEDWGFNGWGGDYNFAKDDPIPTRIATATGATVVNLNSVLTIEGGAYEMDGAGTFLATKTSILSQANPTTPSGVHSLRNLGKTQAQVETILTQNLGATKFIWLDGWFSNDDITDAHIDGFAKFVAENKLVTMNNADLLYWGASQADINTLYAASNANGVAYTKVYLPLTQNNVSKTNGQSLGYKGSYANYYVANNRVLVPNYNDLNDTVANAIIAGLYPGRTVVGIDCRNLYKNGGMVHCVTQQQPMATIVAAKIAMTEIIEMMEETSLKIFPNPAHSEIEIGGVSDNSTVEIYNTSGQLIKKINTYSTGNKISIADFKQGIYFVKCFDNNYSATTKTAKLIKQ
jgi:agmatine deiminase